MGQPDCGWKRTCPECHNEITYKNKYAFKRTEGKPCRKCVMTVRTSGENNPFYGKHHDRRVIELLKKQNKSYTKTPEFAQKVKDAMVNIDTSHDVMQIWIDRYGTKAVQ